MDEFEEDLREILAQSKHKSSGAERFVRASLAENKYPREFLIYFLNSECFGDYESDNPSYEAWKHQQAKVEELQKQVTDLDNRATQYVLDEMATAKLNGELQKRVDAAIKCADLNFWNANTVKAMVEALKGEGQ